MDVLLILGRGINRLASGAWQSTGDLEMCDERGAHLLEWVPPDDSNSCCLVGGGELNLLAGVQLWERYRPAITLCAFGHRSKYLEEVDAPSESEIASARLLEAIPDAKVVVWDKLQPGCRPTNTKQELLNTFNVALKEFGPMASVGLVTVGVHLARTMLFVVRHQQQFPQFAGLRVWAFESEDVLLATGKETYRLRIQALRRSQTFFRSWEREAIGIQRLLLDEYKAFSSV